ncbi:MULTISPECIES: hypothetical protein [unclassified Luteococcus]|uniref:hypothetical protein n=1 Tax=unclassified Luteococcus TaxID=2639923 RepID=UPI00313C22AB
MSQPPYPQYPQQPATAGYPQQPSSGSGGYPPQGGYPQSGYPQPGAPHSGSQWVQPGHPQTAPGWGQPGFEPDFPQVTNPARHARGRKVSIVGACLLALGLVLMPLAIAQFKGVFTHIQQDKVVLVSGSGSIQLNAGDRRTVWSSFEVDAECEVRGPGGQVPFTASGVSLRLQGQRAHAVGSFTATEPGRYFVRCDGPRNVRGYIGQPVSASDFAASGAVFLVACAAMFLGGLVLIVGLLMMRSAKQRR